MRFNDFTIDMEASMIRPDSAVERVQEASSSFNSDMNNFLEMEQ